MNRWEAGCAQSRTDWRFTPVPTQPGRNAARFLLPSSGWLARHGTVQEIAGRLPESVSPFGRYCHRSRAHVIFADLSTTNFFNCLRSTERRWSCAISRVEPTKKRPKNSAGRLARSRARLERARALLRRRLVLRGVTLTIGLAGIAFAAIGAYQTIHRHDRQNLAVHAFMTQLKPCVAASDRDTPVVDTIGRNESPLDLAELHAFARRSAEVANEIARCDPGQNCVIFGVPAPLPEMHEFSRTACRGRRCRPTIERLSWRRLCG